MLVNHVKWFIIIFKQNSLNLAFVVYKTWNNILY